MQKKYKVGLILLLVLIFLAIGIFLGSKFYKNEPTEENKAQEIDTISKFDYTLDNRDTELMKGIFLSLKEELEKDVIDYNKYAEYLSEIFIVDIYTMSNKINKYDIPALEYIFPDQTENFTMNLEDTLYKYLEDNSNYKRSQELPEVSKISMESINNGEYTYLDKQYESYVVKLNWEYVKDLGYDKLATITLIKENEKLYVVNLTNDDEVQDEADN